MRAAARRASAAAAPAAAPRTRMWSMPGPGAENPHSGPVRSSAAPASASRVTLKSPASTTTSSGGASTTREPGGAQQLGVRRAARSAGSSCSACSRRRNVRAVAAARAARPGRSAAPCAQASRATGAEPERARLRVAEAPRVQRQHAVRRARAAAATSWIAFPCPANAERSRPWCELGQRAAERRGIGSGPSTGRAATSPTVKRPSAHAGTSCTQSTSGSSAVASRDHLVEERAPLRRRRVLPWKRFQLRTSTRSTLLPCASCSPIRRRSRPGTTTSSPPRSPRAGADVELATSRFRFGDVPAPDGYRRSERFYPLSSRLFKRSRLRLPLKAVEHLGVLASPGACAPGRPAPAVARAARRPTCTCASARPSVFTAHDLLPRRTASRARPLAAAARPSSTASSCTRERGPRDARRARHRRARHPAPRLPERGDARRRRPRRCSRSA